jgi:2-octaprenyl-6-methoxyphenol hydroxylase
LPALRADVRRRSRRLAALVTAVAHELPHLGTAHQYFMPSGPLAILPVC